MYHVAICDDDNKYISYIEEIVKKAIEDVTEEIKFYEFSSGEKLIQSMDNSVQYDLLILDMQLGKINGDEVAKVFREQYPDVVLVFCSGILHPTAQSFETNPFRYLLKSDPEDRLIFEMKMIMDQVKKVSKDEYILGHYRNNYARIKIRNIIYVENAKRGSRVVVAGSFKKTEFNEMVLTDKKIKEISEIYPQFVFAHSSYIVNINHVENISGTEVELDNGEKLSLSRQYQKSYKEAFVKSVTGKYR